MSPVDFNVNIKNNKFIFSDNNENIIKFVDIVSEIIYHRYGKENIKGKIKFKVIYDEYSDYITLKFKMVSGLICAYNIKNKMFRYKNIKIDLVYNQLNELNEALDSFDERIKVENETYKIKLEPKKLTIIPEFQLHIIEEYERKLESLNLKYLKLLEQQEKFESIFEKIDTNNITSLKEIE